MKRSVFCSNRIRTIVMKEEIVCTVPQCTCDSPVVLNHVLELFALLYSFFDNTNLLDVETLRWTNSEQAEQVHAQVQESWNQHLPSDQELYQEKAWTALMEETKQFVQELVDSSDSKQVLLFRLFSLLQIMDRHLVLLRDRLMIQVESWETFPFSTIYGDVLPKRHSVLLEALKLQKLYKHAIDPNYLLLCNRIHSFHVAQSYYSYYEVEHRFQRLTHFDVNSILDLSIGFLPGKWEVQSDYKLETDESPGDDDLLPFSFSRAMRPAEYNDRVKQQFEALLEKVPDVMILPELFTPPDLRETLIASFNEKKKQMRGSSYSGTVLFLTGSFHEAIEGKLYNRAKVIAASGKLLADVRKMNRFILYSKRGFEGELAPFREIHGVERNAYDERKIMLFDTAWGRIAFFICIDFLIDPIAHILVDRCVDIIFVMAMTPNPAGGKFIRRMQELAERNGAAVIVCNHFGKKEADRSKEEVEARIVVSLPGYRDVFLRADEWGVYSIRDVLTELQRMQDEWDTRRKAQGGQGSVDTS